VTTDSTDNLLPEISARDLAFVVLRRKWGILVILAATMLAAVTWLWFVRDDLYKVSVKVLVKTGREQAPPPTVLGASPMVIGYRSQEVNSEIDIFQSAESLGRAVDELHLDQPIPQPVPERLFARVKYEVKRAVKWMRDWQEELFISLGLRERLSAREKALAALQQGLVVKSQKDSNVFVAELELPFRRNASAVLNALLDNYLVYRQKVYQGGDLNFFRSEVENASTQLQKAEEEAQNFENAENITVLEKQEGVLLENIATARGAWKEMDVERQEFASRVGRVEEELKKDDPDFSGVGEFGHEGFEQELVKQLASLQQERERSRLTELDSGDHIQNNRRQFKTLSAMLAANLRTALAEKEEQTGLRRTQFERLEAQLHDLHDKQMQWLALKRKAKDLEDNYLAYRRKLEEASANDAMEQQRLGNVAVIERALDPLAPSGMTKTTLLAICLLAAFLCALTWVTIVEFFDHRVYTIEDLQRHLSGPVLATISLEKVARPPKTKSLSVYGAD
jgi:uncharacterized protein involved in exopolysaccharide biosynthesis